jgi:threonine aldolase
MKLLSDNTAGIDERVMAALAAANHGVAVAYSDDDWTAQFEEQIDSLFGCDTSAYTVVTGTAANSLALAAVTPPHGAILCHESAHIYIDEAGAPEFYTHGAKLIPLPGEHGKLTVDVLETALERYWEKSVHQVVPAAISITQPTELGTCYTADEIKAISLVAKRENLVLHMDGARFANALSHLGCSPAEISWQAGVDILSLGVTKNGAMAAEALVFFDFKMTAGLETARKRSGHLVSKARFIAAQFGAMLEENHWLELSAHANAMAQLLAQGLIKIDGVELIAPVEANLIFARLPSQESVTALHEMGAEFYVWVDNDQPVVRLVCAYSTTPDEINTFVDAVKEVLATLA